MLDSGGPKDVRQLAAAAARDGARLGAGGARVRPGPVRARPVEGAGLRPPVPAVPAQHAASGHLPQGLRRPAHPMSGKKPRTVEAELQLQPKRNKSKRRVWSMEWSCSTSDFSSFPFPKNLLFGLALCSLSLLLFQWERNQTLAAELCDRLAPVSGDCVSLQPFLQVTNYST